MIKGKSTGCIQSPGTLALIAFGGAALKNLRAA